MTSSIVLAEGVRTAMADYNGLFADTDATDLAVAASREALRRARFEPGEIGHVIFGNVLQTSPDAIYLARHVGLRSAVPKEVPALTVNRLCGSGFEAIVQAKHRILLGETDAVLAGGTENMSQAPFVIRGARTGLRLGQGKLEDSLMSGLFDTVPGLAMAQTSDNIARRLGISREEQDAFALESQKKAADARAKGRLGEEIVAVEAKKGRKTVTVSEDDHLTPDSTLEGLAKLAPAFGKDGMVTAGNASGIVDGAVAVVVTTEAKARAKRDRPARAPRGRGRHGLRSRRDGPRAGFGVPRGAREGGEVTRRHGPRRDQRGVRGPDPRGHQGTRDRSREAERERRRDRARAPAGRERREADAHSPQGAPPARQALGPRLGLHRGRTGDCIGGGSMRMIDA